MATYNVYFYISIFLILMTSRLYIFQLRIQSQKKKLWEEKQI